jgi:hypothetical protein
VCHKTEYIYSIENLILTERKKLRQNFHAMRFLALKFRGAPTYSFLQLLIL